MLRRRHPSRPLLWHDKQDEGLTVARVGRGLDPHCRSISFRPFRSMVVTRISLLGW